MAYRLALPPVLEGVHNVFHISMLRKCLADPNQVVELAPQLLEKDMSYAEHPIKVMDAQDRKLRNKTMRFLKVQWSRHSPEEATWELEEQLKKNFSSLFDTIAY